MTIRRLVIVFSAMLLSVPASARAQIFSCGRYETLADCEHRQALAQETMAREAREIAEVRANAIAGIQQARAKFWATYPDKPGADKARADFAYWLWVKDNYYLRENLKVPVTKDPRTGQRTSTGAAYGLEALGGGSKIDGGIRESATEEFQAWTNAVRDKLFEGHTSNSTDDAFLQGFLATWMGQKFFDAVKASTKEYQAYVTLRDWWEFDHMKRAPAGFDTPDMYGVYLYSRFWRIPLPAATANYKKMTELLGVERVQAAAKRVIDAPKADDGSLVVTVKPTKLGPGGGEVIDYEKPTPEGVIGVFADPVRAMEILASQDDDRRYLLDLLHRQSPDLRKIDPATSWTFADTAYKRLVLAFGEQQVLAASHAVRVAPKRLYSGGVIPVKELGVTRTEPIETVEDLLALKDARGYVRDALIFANGLDTAASVDAAYKTYVAGKGEPAVLEAARRRALNKPQLTYGPELKFLDAEISTPTVVATQGPQKDSPDYLAWKRFAPGASASYISRSLGQRSLRREGLEAGTVGIRTRYLLQSITPERAQLDLTEIAYDPPPASTAHPPRDTEMAYPARLDATPVLPVRTTPLRSGEETLVIGGKQIATHWNAVQGPSSSPNRCGPTIVTTWTSDEIPGGLVRRTVDAMCRDNRTQSPDVIDRTISETLLESFETGGSATEVRPIRPASGIAPILPLPVAASLPDQDQQQRSAPLAPQRTQPAVPAPPVAVVAPANGRRVGVAPAAASGTPASRSASGATVPEGTVITVRTSGPITATNRAGETFTATIIQPVLVNGAPVIPVNTTVTMALAQTSEGLGLKLAGITLDGRTLVASSSPAEPDAMTARNNASVQRAIDGGRAAGRNESALLRRLVVVSGSELNVPVGTRLTFTLSAPIAVDAGGR